MGSAIALGESDREPEAERYTSSLGALSWSCTGTASIGANARGVFTVMEEPEVALRAVVCVAVAVPAADGNANAVATPHGNMLLV